MSAAPSICWRRHALLGAAGRPEGFRLHHVSTDEVFGSLGPAGQVHRDHPLRPAQPLCGQQGRIRPSDARLARDLRAAGGAQQLLEQLWSVPLPGEAHSGGDPACAGGKPFPVYGDGLNVRDWLFVEDHAEALLAVLTRGAVGRSYNIGGEAEARNIDLVRMICALMDEMHPEGAPHDRLIRFVADRPGHDARYAIDPARIRAELGWQPTVTLAEGLRRTVAWYLANEVWWRPLLARAGVGQRLGMRA